ncbi:MAG: preprotein translocase subunit SecG [Candidatus Anammoxibacter sp.]
MNRSESIIKWAIVIVIIFGLQTTFFILEWTTVLKVSLIIVAIAMIGNILLQSGRGGGLAAIGGLTDQSMMGTQTGAFLQYVTFLLGAVFFVTVIFVSKASFSPNVQAPLSVQNISIPVPAAHDHDQKDGSQNAEESSIGMKEVKKTDTENDSKGKIEDPAATTKE